MRPTIQMLAILSVGACVVIGNTACGDGQSTPQPRSSAATTTATSLGQTFGLKFPDYDLSYALTYPPSWTDVSDRMNGDGALANNGATKDGFTPNIVFSSGVFSSTENDPLSRFTDQATASLSEVKRTTSTLNGLPSMEVTGSWSPPSMNGAKLLVRSVSVLAKKGDKTMVFGMVGSYRDDTNGQVVLDISSIQSTMAVRAD